MPTPEFILNLREHVGHDLLWLTGVTAVIVDDEGRVLLHQRSDTGQWALISGILEPGEQPAVAVVREAFEETGVHIEVDRITSVLTGPAVAYPNGDRVQFMDVAFRCRPVGGEAQVNDDESLAVGWFAPDDLPPLDDDHRARLLRALKDEPAAYFVQP
ncbi:NUDIX hydrolase [Jiangella alkaliphila]|uniref:ADP-ribose pyrophosphatase YjhB, NUDIX family n=1 Tax=Jiangella alkaliphila TaxID=419479 RepID=A0A1H2M356_9ACTN|nr:NUDIX domain-containing protein [Jiangella alkaliphila]SDU87564.1 ADP-ribose pyrophosphatase YjhB, NUDIX family [Jiangella alkaliphila]